MTLGIWQWHKEKFYEMLRINVFEDDVESLCDFQEIHLLNTHKHPRTGNVILEIHALDI